jgi:hypothetical protein
MEEKSKPKSRRHIVFLSLSVAWRKSTSESSQWISFKPEAKAESRKFFNRCLPQRLLEIRISRGKLKGLYLKTLRRSSEGSKKMQHQISLKEILTVKKILSVHSQYLSLAKSYSNFTKRC